MELQELLRILEEGAWELINFGDSHEKAQGQGMMTIIIAIKKLIKENNNQLTKESREGLINSIKKELKKEKESVSGYKSSSFLDSVWFYPLEGRFLYNDQFLYYDIVEPLIQIERLVFDGIKKHQGVKMLRYVLSEYELKKENDNQ